MECNILDTNYLKFLEWLKMDIIIL